MEVQISLHNGAPNSIELPQRVVLEVIDTEPVVRGQTASSSFKPASLSNGVRTMVPPHVTAGTRVVIMTNDGSYVERAKDQSSEPFQSGQRRLLQNHVSGERRIVRSNSIAIAWVIRCSAPAASAGG